MIYTGIGSRFTPIVVLDLMTEVGTYFGKHGITLRSGGAAGADSAFEAGCDFAGGPKQIFFPSIKFNGKSALDHPGTFYMDGPGVNSKLAYDLAEKVWNSRSGMPIEWRFLKPFTKMLMARNTMQLLGPQLSSPTKIIICWTEDGEATGGTGQALAMANQINMNKKLDYVIPMINLQKESHRELITNVLKGSDPNEFIKTIQGFLLKECGKIAKE
jgi:hypothetical protein